MSNIKINECCDGGSCTSNSNSDSGNLGSTNGVGNAIPAQIAAMTAAEQTDPKSFGSGDKFGNSSKKRYYIVKKKKDKIVKIKENLSFDDANLFLENSKDTDYKIYLMA